MALNLFSTICMFFCLFVFCFSFIMSVLTPARSNLIAPFFNTLVAFSSRVRILGECLTIHSPPAFFFFKVEISLRTLIPHFMQGSVHSGSASWDDWDRAFPPKATSRNQRTFMWHTTKAQLLLPCITKTPLWVKVNNCKWGRPVRKRTWKMYSPMSNKRWEIYKLAL